MSHVTEFSDVTITSIPALQLALQLFCPQLELVPGNHYRTYKDENNGRLVGDWAPPPGVTESQVGENAEYVIRVNDAYVQAKHKGRRDGHSCPYEIGVVPARNGQPGQYTLMADFWLQGRGILQLEGVGAYDEHTGKAFDQLYMHYRMAEDKLAAEALGDQIYFTKVGDHYESTIDTTARLGY